MRQTLGGKAPPPTRPAVEMTEIRDRRRTEGSRLGCRLLGVSFCSLIVGKFSFLFGTCFGERESVDSEWTRDTGRKDVVLDVCSRSWVPEGSRQPRRGKS
jgi:hypothetical protein